MVKFKIHEKEIELLKLHVDIFVVFWYCFYNIFSKYLFQYNKGIFNQSCLDLSFNCVASMSVSEEPEQEI